MQGLKVIFGIDRAGFVGDDGESHQGIFDTAYLMSVPNLTIYAPTYYNELSSMMYQAVYKDKYAVAIRYPRGAEIQAPNNYVYDKQDYICFGNTDASNCIITYGREFNECYNALANLEDTYLIKLNKIKPVDSSVCDLLKNTKNIYFFEEGIKTGGVGEIFASVLEENGISASYKLYAVPDEFVKQATVNRQIEKYSLDSKSIVEIVNNGKE